MRSFGRASMNFETTDLITSRRFVGCPLSLKSSAAIEPEQSRARIISTPLASTVEELRPGQSDDDKAECKETQRADPAARSTARLARHLPGDFGAGVFHGGHRAAPAAQKRDQGKQSEQPKELRVKETDHDQ